MGYTMNSSVSRQIAETRERPHDASTVFRDPNEVAVRKACIRLLREILECQRRLTALLERDDPAEAYLVTAARKAIRIRRQLLRDLPEPIDRATPDPWGLGTEHTENA